MKGYWEGLASALVLLAVFAIARKWDFTFSVTTEALIISIITVVFAIILGRMLTGQINLDFLISEDNGHASLSRFQFLIFTFVIAGGYLLLLSVALENPTDAFSALISGNLRLPEIPSGVLGLIGISGGSYVISKGIQQSATTNTGSAVTTLNLISAGAGYAANTHVDLVFIGGGGSGAKAYATVDATQTVTGIVLQSAGSGYSSAPDITIPVPAGGTPAVAKAVIS